MYTKLRIAKYCSGHFVIFVVARHLYELSNIEGKNVSIMRKNCPFFLCYILTVGIIVSTLR